ncbi:MULTISPECIES: translation initiation factor IF-2 N-terminal domain-containing protein [unclassified Nocardia]|uniref:translation initiation factor IF-2 N-terminal domain-containing protein n=1 Tax=unclassified Nocardia TaxID=2637762 RepID=UPI001CE40C08|nr:MULTISPECIES: translation initiation factor IF-2 N-terminal domain-containing protein [unclassified Nocardia]
MADQEPLDTTKQDAEQLPERIRVHALAKLLGVTSKRILAKLSEMGADARSAQSNVDRAVAESVVDAFGPRAVEAAPDPVPEQTTDSKQTAEQSGAEQPAEPVTEPVVEVTETAEAQAEPSQPPGMQLFTSPVQEDPHVSAPVVFESAAVHVPLFLPPDAAAAEAARKQRRAERQARRAEEPVAEVVEEEPDTITADEEPETAEQSGDADDQPRRRRRGRRGRGRGRGEQHAESDEQDTDSDTAPEWRETERPGEESADEANESAESTDDGDADEEAVPEGASRRRRRRRRRKVAGESGEAEPADDDPPNTVVHEREPRNKSRARAASDEVQGITGSTRLEAKRQRRRDGREAGRRRPPILTESEFLARREAVDRVMVVREKSFPGANGHDHPTTTQVAVLEDNVLVEHFVTNTGSASMVGNVYLGKVQNVLPSMEAAFVDIGRGRNGVLYAGEVNWEAAGLGGKERKIEQALKPGDQVLVQVSKDPVGHKGARLTTQISLAGRFLVYVPGGTSTGISRKLPDTERKRLKEILRDIVPADAGVIIRTASEGVSEAELARDVERLQATWRTIEKAAEGKDSGGPKTLYEEPDLLVKVIRDLFNEDFSRLVIEGERAWSTVENYIRTVAPDLLARVSRHENNGIDVFETYRIDEQLAKALDRKVWLPSGGTLVIDRTEAMTVIDVNTGKFTGSGGSNLEETVTRNNLEAAEEIVRQMRLRDIGGMIVVDFIDMVLESNRDLVLRRLTEALGRDRTRHQVSEVTSLGLVQMTRKKLGTGLVEAFSSTCEHCHGRGIIVHTYPVEPSSSEDSVVRTKESGSRRRRGRDKTTPAVPPVVVEPAHEASEEDAAVKRAHPVALAMAAHLAEEAAVHEAESAAQHASEAGAAAVTAEIAAAEAVSAVAEGVDAASAAAEAESAAAAAESSAAAAETVASEADSAAATAAVAAQVAAEAAAEAVTAEVSPAADEKTKPVAAEAVPAAESNGTARPARRRRVARSAAAPAADSASAVFVLSADQPPAAVIDYSDPEPVELPHRGRPRRRAVGRPAGAPEAGS